jgi:serine/threonine protein kinase
MGIRRRASGAYAGMTNLGTLLHLEGRIVGGCRLIRRLGVGGMGEVYLAEQVRLGNRRVAVKIVRPDGEAGQDYRDAARRFLHEGRMLAGFAHPNVLPVHDSGVEDGCFYLVMEYAPDGSLKDALGGRGLHPLSSPVEVGLAVEIVSQIAAALQYTHERGIVHGDVKPGNVLVETEPDGHRRMLLADFGVARELEATAHLSRVTGTVAYMAPEQFSGIVSPGTDQYALGVVAYQLLAGRTPFEGGFAEQMRGHLDLAPAPLRGFNRATPRSVEAVIRRALAKEPTERFPTILAFADALELALRSETESTFFGAPGGWDETVTVRPALASRRQQAPRSRVERSPAPVRRTHQPPNAGGIFFANEFATERFPSAAPATRHLDQRRLGVFAICVALLLVATLVALGTNTTRSTSAFGPNTQDIASGGHPHVQTTTTPVAGRPSTPTPAPSAPPIAIENDFAGDAFRVGGVSEPPSVAPGQPIVASITLVNIGFNTWTAAAGYRLTCDTLHQYPARSNCPTGFAVSVGQHAIAPGGAITFTITLTAPSIPGAYNAWLSMARGDALFSTMGTAHLALLIRYPAPTGTPPPQATATPQPTNTPQPVPTNTPQPAPTDTPQPTNTPQPTETPTPQPTPTETPEPTPTETPAPTATTQATDTPQATSTVQSTDTPVDTGTPSPVPTSSAFPLSLWRAI